MRNWERPMVTVDTFVANEFVSTCGENHKVYNFECNAGDEDGMYDVFTNDGRNLTKGILNYYHPCDRCMNDVKQTFKYSFNHILCLKDNDSDLNETYIILDEYELDLDKQVETDLFLELPSKVLCSDNCKGLCDKCGKDLNKGTCNCVTYQVDPRLEVLKDLID